MGNVILKEAAILREVQREVPFNNFANLFIAQHEEVNPQLGGDCIHQAVMIGRRLRSAIGELQITFHNDMNMDISSHTVAVSGEKGERQLLYEVTHFAAHPLSLATLKQIGKCEIPTLPEVSGRHRSLEFVEHGMMTMMYRKEHDGTVLQGNMFDVSHSDIDLGEALHPISDESVKNYRRRLHLHLLEADNGKSEVELDTMTGKMTACKVGEKKVPERHTRKFPNEMERIATALGVTRKALENFFRDGWELYKEERPDWNQPPRRGPFGS